MNRFWNVCAGLVLGVFLWGSSGTAFAQTSCDKPNVLLLINKSSNMAAKWTTAMQALGQIVPARSANTRFGMMLFDTSSKVSVTIRDNSLTALAQALGTTRPGGKANHKAAFAAARTYLMQEIGRDTVPTRSYFVLLVTDGNSSDGDPNTSISALRSITTSNGRKKDVKTYVLAASPSTSVAQLLLTWSRTGGTFRPYLTQQASQLSSSMANHEPRPRREQCNNQDDDCDGQVDENVQRSCLAPCPGGTTTATGLQTCSKGQFGPCQVQKRPETCNGRDDDCNGKVDDNIKPLNCQTSCGTGTRQCSGGRWGACSAPFPAPEVCDGKDNDCDGEIDERCPCKQGDTRACGKDTGTCSKGIQTCQNGIWSPFCQGEQRPRREICDNKDNDCDGLIDDNIARSCNNLCGRGIERCTAGKWAGCTAPKPKPEVCGDNVDNDCDGIIDEGCVCRVGQTRQCGTGTGACRKGFQVCTSGRWDTRCINSVGPSPEACDRIDNDCDGQTDENITRPCKNGCGSGVERCSFGRWFNCSAPRPTQEICDNKDNDCDGQIDESLAQPCYTGPGGTQNVGECKGGSQTCLAGKWGTCLGQIIPQKEACDNKDNDCDGQIDETCPCKAGQVQACGLDIGACQKGKQACVSGQWGPCTGAVNPKAETCNSTDDDCDGQIDENLTRSCSNNCGKGTEFCFRGRWGGCSAPRPRPEICGNKVDDDCDGQVDENCPCKIGETRACGSSVGECKSGVQDCVAGRWSNVCKGGVTASPETCDRKDNDCNGQIDDGIQCACKEGATRPCFSGPPGSQNKGECRDGKQTCTKGAWSACAGEIKPATEVCDNKDNDCDGKIDDSISKACYTGPAGTQGKGLCKGGKQICSAGKWSMCQGEVIPRPEKCGDNVDNDCDGQSEEGCPCKLGDRRACGPPAIGECKRGIQACSNGAWGSCLGVIGPKVEVCDSKDNDCDGQIDEGNPGAGAVCAVPGLKGPCAKGSNVCQRGRIVCAQTVKPRPELCNKIDDDCDGIIDEAGACPVCKDGQKRVCYTGPANTAGKGNCRSGGQICQGGQWSRCQGEVLPSQEFCDGRDNNCNGQVDEGLVARPCKSICGSGKEVCLGGKRRCDAPLPKPEVCDSRDNDCNGMVDDSAPCPPGLKCMGGRCLSTPTPDAGGPDVRPGCRSDLDCPPGRVCRANQCVFPVPPDVQPDVQPDFEFECHTDRNCPPGRFCLNGKCEKNTVPDQTPPPDQVIPGTSCIVNGDCSTGSVCRWGRCVLSCSTDLQCTKSATPGVCRLGLCVVNCVVDKHCGTGLVCRAGWCKQGCRESSDCKNGEKCEGYACVDACTNDSECKPSGSYCSASQNCLPRCNLAADCPAGYSCQGGKCLSSCSPSIAARACGENRVCSAGSCTDDCNKLKCPSTSTFDCQKSVCVGRCQSSVECPSNQACLSGSCVARCSIQDDCRPGQRCAGGLCQVTCQTNKECPSGRACLVGRCVEACSGSNSPSPAPIPVDAGNPTDAGPNPDQAKPKLCGTPTQTCSGDSCLVTCKEASNCPTGYGCGVACVGCTETVCLPPCRIDGDCPSKFFCYRGLCSLGCQNDQQCGQGESCNGGHCERNCTKDADCPRPQTCEKNICADPDPLKKDRDKIGPGGLPKLKLAGGCGCQTTASGPASWGLMFMLLFLFVPFLRRKRSQADD